MKKFAFAVATVVLLVPTFAMAQARQGGQAGQAGPGGAAAFRQQAEKRQKEFRDKVVKELKLNADQIKKYDALQKKMSEKREKLMAEMGPRAGAQGQRQGGNAQQGQRQGGNAQQGQRQGGAQGQNNPMREAMQKMRTEYQTELKKIFTAAQFKQYEKLMEEQRRARQQQGGPGGAAGGQRQGGGGARAGGGN